MTGATHSKRSPHGHQQCDDHEEDRWNAKLCYHLGAAGSDDPLDSQTYCDVLGVLVGCSLFPTVPMQTGENGFRTIG